MRSHQGVLVGSCVLFIVAVFGFVPRPARAAGTVGSGSVATCTEAALDTVLSGGGSLTFNCGGPATITFTATKTITTATTITGNGSGVTLSGGGWCRCSMFRTPSRSTSSR